jgi:type IV pilus assembly protein PilV
MKNSKYRKNYANNEKGFSLLEVLISIVVLSIGLLGVANMQVVAIRINDNANRLTQATTITQDKVEELMALPFDTLTSNEDTNEGYAVQWQVDDNADGTKTINVNTTWVNSGAPKSFSLSAVRSPFQ